MDRKHVSSGSYLEPIIGFSRAVRVGPHISVGGTAPIAAEGGTVGVGDVHTQMLRCLEISKTAIEAAGGALSDVVRTRIMLTDIALWEDAARAHALFFKEIRPVTTVIEVSAFVDPDWLVETEIDCIVAGDA